MNLTERLAILRRARHFSSVDELVSKIDASTVLVKGSRFMKMERVVAALTGTTEGGH